MAAGYHAERDPDFGIPAIDPAAHGVSGVAIQPELMADPVQKDVVSMGAHDDGFPVIKSMRTPPLKLQVHDPMHVPFARRRSNRFGKAGVGNMTPYTATAAIASGDPEVPVIVTDDEIV